MPSIIIGYYPKPTFTLAAIGPGQANPRQYLTLSSDRDSIEPTPRQHRGIIEPLSRQLRDLAMMFDLQIIETKCIIRNHDQLEI